MIKYNLTRSRRKTIAIYIRDGKVEVRAPLQASKVDIDMFILSKEAWIHTNLAKQTAQASKREGFVVDYGSLLTWRGKVYPLTPQGGSKAGFDGTSFYMPPGLRTDQIKATCVKLYRRLALIHFENRVSYYSKIMGVTPSAVKVNSAKTRWGSCSSKKSINFSWRLALADDDVIDYVVVHELAHLKEMNHSPRFWKLVEEILPNRKDYRKRLKDVQKQLEQEDWD